MLRQFVGGNAASAVAYSPVDGLSDRELEVLRLIGQGHGTRQIAEELHLSIKTVESYQGHLKDKLSLKNSRELVQYAIQWSMRETAELISVPHSYRGIPDSSSRYKPRALIRAWPALECFRFSWRQY